mgnify:CR=1 FL=1
MDDEERHDRLAIRELIENWVVWRDAGDWERFRTVWFDDGLMMATWTQGTADEFIAMSKAGWSRSSWRRTTYRWSSMPRSCHTKIN